MLRTGDAAKSELTLERQFEKVILVKLVECLIHSLSKLAAHAAKSARILA